MDKGNKDEMQLAINGMNSRWKSSTGANEPRTIKGVAPKINSDVYKSTYEVAEAINNPKYSNQTRLIDSVVLRARCYSFMTESYIDNFLCHLI